MRTNKKGFEYEELDWINRVVEYQIAKWCSHLEFEFMFQQCEVYRTFRLPRSHILQRSGFEKRFFQSNCVGQLLGIVVNHCNGEKVAPTNRSFCFSKWWGDWFPSNGGGGADWVGLNFELDENSLINVTPTFFFSKNKSDPGFRPSIFQMNASNQCKLFLKILGETSRAKS